MNIAQYSIEKKTVTWVIVFFIMIGGLFAFGKLGRLEDPEFTIKEAQIITNYPGASAKEVEEEVTDKVETAVQQLSQLKKVRSLSKPGISIVTAEIKNKYDKYTLPQVWDELRRKVTDVQSKLPPGAGPSIVQDDYGDVFGILLAVNGKGYSYKELEEYADFLRRELLLVKDVAKVEIFGLQPQEVHLVISRERMVQLGINLEQISNTLVQQNLVVPSGQVRVGDDFIQIKPTGKFTTVQQIGDLLLKGTKPGNLIYLRDIGEITSGYKTPPEYLIHHDGQFSLAIGISVVSGGDVVQMGESIKKQLKSLMPLTPVGINTEIISFQSDYVTKSINDFLISLVEALVIVIVVLIAFIGLTSSLIVGAALLLTVFGTLIGMQMWGINLERISLGALIIALGMLVDNAIVINDGILIRIQQGMDRIKAANDIVNQSAMPLLGATVIAILAFAAIGLSQDSTGEYTRSLFQVVLISLLLSWVVAVTVIPLLCVDYIKVKKGQEIKDPYAGRFFSIYRKFLKVCIQFRWITVSTLVILLLISLYGFTRLEQSFFPESTRQQFMIHFWLPEGTDIRKTTSDVTQLEKYIKNLPDVTAVTSFIGRGAPRFILTYTPEKSYSSYAFLLVSVTSYQKIPALMSQVNKYVTAHYINAMVKLRNFVLGPTTEDTIEARFSGPDPTILRKLADQAKHIYYEDGGLIGIKDDWRERVKVIQPVLAQTQASEAGISKSDVDKILQMTYNGLQVGLYREYDKLLPILAISPLEEHSTVNTLQDVHLWSPAAQRSIPLQQILSGTNITYEDTAIQRRQRVPTITAQATQKSGNASVAFNRIKDKIEEIVLPSGYKFEWGGEYEKAHDAQTALFAKIPMVFCFVILLLVMLFNSIRQPLIIILTVPLAVIGVTCGLLFMHLSFGFMALLGFLSLFGMLIKNSIVLIDQINLEIGSGKNLLDAILDSSVSRLRPVSLAAFTTVLGVIPLLSDVFFVAMAVTIMAGLTFATVLTLVVVPVLYAIFFRAK